MSDSDNGSSDYDPLDPDADYFHPPSISTLVGCLHCGEEYDSYRIVWRIETDADGNPHGFWCCPIEGCDGKGFGFDIHPVDSDYIDPDGRDIGVWVEDPPPDPETNPDRPPQPPTTVRCERCGRQYRSDQMIWRVECDDDGEPYEGWWACPTEDCGGEGFGVDVRPTDPTYVDPHARRIRRPGEKPEPPPPIDSGDVAY